MSTLHGWTPPTSFVRVADVKPGMILVADDGFPCIGCFSLRSVRLDPKLGPYIDCCGEDGCVGPHTLDGQVSEKTNPHYDPENPVYVGLWAYDPENPPPPARKCEYEQSTTATTGVGDTEKGMAPPISTVEEAVAISERIASNMPSNWPAPQATVDFCQPAVRSVRYGDLFGERPVQIIPVGEHPVGDTRIIDVLVSDNSRRDTGRGQVLPFATYPGVEAPYAHTPVTIRLTGRGEEKGVIATLSPDNEHDPVGAEQPVLDKSSKITIGSVVVPISPTRPLRTGSSLYSDAIVASVAPFVLVSGDGTMVWSETQSSESVRCVPRKATAVELSTVIGRIGRDVDTQKLISAASLLALAAVLNAAMMADRPVLRPTFGAW